MHQSHLLQFLYPLDEFDGIVANRAEVDGSTLFTLGSPLRQIMISSDYEEQGEQYALLQIVISGG